MDWTTNPCCGAVPRPESWRPFFKSDAGRLRHAAHNLALALVNAMALALLFGVATVVVADWAETNRVGLLHTLELPWAARLLLAIVLLDAWMYVWHRANHVVPWLWRFHRMHHSDTRMDVTTATRFHLGEHAGGALLRLGLVPLAGFEAWQLIAYDTLVVAVTMLHHANVSLGRADRWLRWLIVTPFIHKVHHSRAPHETNSNYATVLSIWDRLAWTFRLRADPATIDFGLDGFDDPHWQTFAGMWQTPLRAEPTPADEPALARSEREWP